MAGLNLEKKRPWLVLILFALSALFAVSASAQWDGALSEAPQGGGTSTNPYLIARPENLEWIRVQKKDFNGTYFLLTADLDMGGHEWKVIQPSTGSNIPGFRGHIDGAGHTISNFTVLWNANNLTVGFGLFSFIKDGSVKNLTLKDVTVTRSANGNLRSNTQDIKIGILAGALGQKCTISNINLLNCRIDDGGGAVEDGQPYTLYIGGLAGDVASGFGGSDNVLPANAPSVSNIVSQVDIDLSHTTRYTIGSTPPGKLPQFNVGGIFGRMRRIPVVGTNLTYTGSINAPIGSVAPIYSIIRYNGNNDMLSLAKAYGGESNAQGDPMFDYTRPAEDMFYFNYRVWNPVASTPDYKDISDTYPAGGDDWVYGARTFLPNSDASMLTTANMNSPEVWARYQGVNRGSSLDAPTAVEEGLKIGEALRLYNESLAGAAYKWGYNENNSTITLAPVTHAITINQTEPFVFTADVSLYPANESPSKFRFKWSALLRRDDGVWAGPIDLWMDPNEQGNATSQLVLDDQHWAMLCGYNDGREFDPFTQLYARVELYRHDYGIGADEQILSGGVPVCETAQLHPVSLTISDPVTFTGTIGEGADARVAGSYCVSPQVKIGIHDMTQSPRFVYKWLVKQTDGTWAPPACPFNSEGSVEGFFFPSIASRHIKAQLYGAATGVLLAEAERELAPVDLRISSLHTPDVDEQLYALEAVSPYDGRAMNAELDVDWSVDIPGMTLADDHNTTKIYNSALDPTLQGYTLTASVTGWPGASRVVTLDVDRLMLYFSEERDADGNSLLHAMIALTYGTTPGRPNKYTGSLPGSWQWLAGDLSGEQSLVDVGEYGQFTVVTEPDGLETRLYGIDANHIYKVIYRAASGREFEYDKSMARTLYVYDAALTAANKTATDFRGIDPDGNPYPDGDDTNDGLTPWRALKTIEEAYRRLPAGNGVADNRIVVMGLCGQATTYRYRSSATDKIYANLENYAKAATVTGSYYAVEPDGTVKPTLEMIDYGGAIYLFTDPTFQECGIAAPTEFSNIAFWNGNAYSMIFYANRHDLTIGKGVTFKNFRQLGNPTTLGLLASDIVPEITVVAGKHDYDHETDDYVRPQNVDPYLTTLVVRSGGFARLICAARNDHLNENTRNVTGSPEEPFRSHVVIDIDPDSGVDLNPYYVGKKYSHDIGLVTGGQTDGSVWGDVSIEMHAGRVSRYISGNISFGRPMGEGYPDDSFFGRTEFSFYDGEIGELYGGSLGRFASSDAPANYIIAPYFYGTSIINIYGGKIHSNLYGAGAGGVMGIGKRSDTPGIIDYSPDSCIPYYDSTGQLTYGSYDDATAETSRIPDIVARVRDYQGLEGEDDAIDNFTRISLVDSHVEVNIHGGIIYGNVYGGGFGYSASAVHNRAPYGIDSRKKKIGVSGNLYGESLVTMDGGTVYGNIYGAGAGSDRYATLGASGSVDFSRLALLFGNTDVRISGGTIGTTKEDFDDPADITDLSKTPLDYYDRVGNVYGAGQGLEGHAVMATLYGNSRLTVAGGKVMGNAFAGGDFSNIARRPCDPDTTGNASVYINGGILGNAIFGGSRGSVGANATQANIEGNTFVQVNGGDFFDSPFINEVDNTHGYRSFNIYGGGYINCIVDGTARVEVNHSLMASNGSFMAEGENPNEWPDAVSDFQRAYLDITYRHFCVYGGGFGENTRVLNTDVSVYISTLLNEPHGRTLAYPYFHQSLFDIAGGGYSGDVGYWASNGLDPADPGYDAYDHYVGGNCKVTIDGYTYARKVIGGGFYGSCLNSDITIKCGSLRQIYGGSLLGYVHGTARLTYGNRIQDFLPGFDGDYSLYTQAQIDEAARRAKALNKYLYVTENMYGGNDVKGIIGTTRWVDPLGNNGIEGTDGAPLFAADVDPANDKGIIFNIYGGTLMGDVYCAGNGYYRGYYVPEWVRYNDGPARMYSPARSSIDPTKTGYVYRARPMVGCVKAVVQGNSADDCVTIYGDFYGGGRACTIGQWNTLLPFEDPRRLVKGGYLRINLGSYVNITGAMYMGADGSGFSEQTVLPADAGIDLSTFDGSTTKQLLRLGSAAYGHWYYNTKSGRYEPGFPLPGETDGNYGFTGEHMLRGYLKNIEMPGDVVLTFYKDPYSVGDDGHYLRDESGNLIYKRWVPAERAVTLYDSEEIYMHDFFLGGRCGSMTNNNVMHYDFGDGNLERYGSIYRVSLPRGLTLTNSAVMGSRDAGIKIYPYNADFTGYYTTETGPGGETVDRKPYYDFDGGITTQSPLTYDIIAYNDMMERQDPDFIRLIGLPADFYTNPAYASIRDASTYTMADGTVIKRKKFVHTPYFPNWDTGHGVNLGDNRYDLAVVTVDGKDLAYAGARETRAAVTAVKAGFQCKFALEDIADPSLAPALGGGGVPAPTGQESAPINPYARQGGIIYGGCYKSGITMGDVIMLVASDMAGGLVTPDNAAELRDLTGIKYNIGRVYGGGFGYDTKIDGNTYVNLVLGFRGLNVFGGGLGGSVTGRANVNYIGSEQSYVFGSIYGGGLLGEVGTSYKVLDGEGNLIDCLDSSDIDPVTHQPRPAKATFLTMLSGNARRVFGGSCMADIYGSANVTLEDQAVTELDHLDLEQMMVAPGAIDNMRRARLIVGAVYGGNDVAGKIHTFGDDTSDTNILVHEYRKSDDDARTLSPGSADNYNGFPLIGSLFGAGNGDYGTSTADSYDEGTSMQIYLGSESVAQTDANGWAMIDLAGTKIPNVEEADINITGGTIVSAYCGGNKTTVTGRAKAVVDYNTIDARAGFDNTNEVDDPKRVWSMLDLASQEQFNEVLDVANDSAFIYKYQIYHFFSGNDNADMAIQPDVRLLTGHIGSAYGGGNNGRMTYWSKDALGRNRGIELTVNSERIHIESLYGGGRVGDIRAIDPATGLDVTFGPDEYGATVNVYDGLIEAVYGGNDVCGYVHNGTNVNIYGAISGDVYGAGNGNYLYMLDTSLPVGSTHIYEDYDDERYGGRYFRLPPKTAYGADDPTDAQKIMAINSYRPNVDKAYLNIHGSKVGDQVKRVWVKGSVFCGGNSSTIRTNTEDENRTIRFNIGDYVTLNNVFLGSNGAELADTRDDGAMLRFEKINSLLLNDPNDLTADQLPAEDTPASSHDHYPYLLSLYMRAVEVDGVPDDFNFDITKDESYIGNFCLGGNHGSMMTDKTIKVTLPETLTVFGNVIGGCYDTAFRFRDVLHSGGMTRFLNHEQSGGAGSSDVGIVDPSLDEDNKVWLIVKSKFAPLRVEYPIDGDIFKIKLVDDVVTTNGVTHYGRNTCNIYGGCYQSGLTVGDIRVDLYSDMLAKANLQYVLNGIDFQSRSFDVVGAGYGKMSMLIGDTKVRMLPSHSVDGEGVKTARHPACAALFGGSQEGQMVGNTFVSIRDGNVFTNVYGASESALLRGSTNVLIGYPEFYRCQKTGVYNLRRADEYSAASINNITNAEGKVVIKKQIWLLEGDVVASNVRDMVVSRVDMEAGETLDTWFGEPTSSQPETFGATWDDIEISVGRNNLYDLDAPYYGHGNVYGGGFVSNNSDVSLAGQPTVLKFDDYADRVSHQTRKEYGGNAMILISDNPRNSDVNFTGAPTMALRDHISIGTARLKKIFLKAGENKVGKYYVDESQTGYNRFVHQEYGIVTADDVDQGRNVFYDVEGDGGIYGGGRKVFVEGFRACDLTGYGYAEHTPQHPKHLNTIQRIDLFTMRDCCFQLVGAPDYANTKIDATPYAMTRVGELRMESSLPPAATLATGVDLTVGKDPEKFDPRIDKPGYLIHNTPRTRNYMGFFRDINFVGAIYSSTGFDDAYHGADGAVVTGKDYRTYKEAMAGDRNDENVNFPRRNVATSHNMIGINNGYTLKIQGPYTQADGGKIVDKLYYGPIIGVVEIKLLTLLPDEGGGYIYALNKHDATHSRSYDSDEPFVETTGNFVFPGRLFSAVSTDAHYMFDDCYPLGYDVMTDVGAHQEGWRDEEIHYWFVSGNSYFFNTTLTAYTYNHPKDFFLNNYDNLIMLSGVEAGKSDIRVKSVVWGSHPNEPYACDLTDYERTGADSYQLYISVDKNTDKFLPEVEDEAIKNGSYVARLPAPTTTARPRRQPTA